MPDHLIHSGRSLALVYWSEEGDRCEFSRWFDQDIGENDRTKILNKFQILAGNGYPKNEQLFKEYEDGIFAIKPTTEIRLLGFKVPGKFIIVEMTIKKKRKADPGAVERAKRLRSLFHAEKSRLPVRRNISDFRRR